MKKLLIVWGVVDFLLLAAGGISIAFAIVWAQPNLLLNMFISRFDLNSKFPIAMVQTNAVHEQN